VVAAPLSKPPQTGLHGYWRDYIVPLACDGPDMVSNLSEWRTIRDARANNRWERNGFVR
jgi:hypothetical protein